MNLIKLDEINTLIQP